MLITRKGLSIRFSEGNVRSMGRGTTGVRGIRLTKGDVVVALAIVEDDHTLLVAGEQGIGKRTAFGEYRVQSRGGKGIITMKTTDKTGLVVGALSVREEDEMMMITFKGLMVRTPVKDIRATGRNTQGVKLINLAKGDRLQAIAQVIDEEKAADGDEETEPGEGGGEAQSSETGRMLQLSAETTTSAQALSGHNRRICPEFAAGEGPEAVRQGLSGACVATLAGGRESA